MSFLIKSNGVEVALRGIVAVELLGRIWEFDIQKDRQIQIRMF